jgi:hypothetical protein
VKSFTTEIKIETGQREVLILISSVQIPEPGGRQLLFAIALITYAFGGLAMGGCNSFRTDMFTYTIVYMCSCDFDGSYTVDSFATDNRREALDWLSSDRLLDLQVNLNLPVPKSAPSEYDQIAF